MSLEAEKQLSENGNWELGIQVKYVKGKVIVISTDLYLKRGTVPFKPYLSSKMLMMSIFLILKRSLITLHYITLLLRNLCFKKLELLVNFT